MPSITLTLINSNPEQISPEDWEEICEELFEEIKENTPLDTGYCQSQWEISQTADDIFVIVNSAEYASFLEDGWSDQAPNGMVQPALEKLPSLIRRKIKKRKLTGEVYASLEIPDYVPHR